MRAIAKQEVDMADKYSRWCKLWWKLQMLFARLRATAPVMAAVMAAVAALALFSGRPALADTVVVLNADSGTEAPSNSSFPLVTGGTTQYLLSGTQLSSVVAGSRLTGIGFRLDGGESTQSGDAIYTSYTVHRLAEESEAALLF